MERHVRRGGSGVALFSAEVHVFLPPSVANTQSTNCLAETCFQCDQNLGTQKGAPIF
jgi:hypothetical protein